MVRKYKRKIGARSYLNYTKETLEKALKEIDNGKSLCSVSKKYKIPKGTLSSKRNGTNTKKPGGQCRLTEECEILIARMISVLTNWRAPLTSLDVRYIVKGYLDKRNIMDSKFKDNLPGRDWVQSFMKRHKLTRRMADNVKRTRAEVNQETLDVYFDNLEKELEGIPYSNIYNYDETNMTDDPGSETVIVHRGLRRVERIVEHSKQSTSVMYCGTAAGEFLPPMVVYKALNLYKEWVQGGPEGAVYDNTQSGWFDMATFERWFKEILLPNAMEKEGTKAIIGDNLGSHFSPEVIRLTEEHDIKFISLHPNSTHICQPLDVAVFRCLKINWRRILEGWRKETRRIGSIPKPHFPGLLLRLCNTLNEDHLISGFKATGIAPINRQQVYKRLPSTNKDPGGDETKDALNASVMTVLKEHCGIGAEKSKTSNKRGPKVTPGSRVTSKVLEEAAKEKEAKKNKKRGKGKGKGKQIVRKKPTPQSRLREERWTSSESEEETWTDLPGPSKKKKVSPPPSETEEEIILSEGEGSDDRQDQDEPVWVCQACNEHWDEYGDDRWVLCDACNRAYHLQCSGIHYITTEYYDIDLDDFNFYCHNCC